MPALTRNGIRQVLSAVFMAVTSIPESFLKGCHRTVLAFFVVLLVCGNTCLVGQAPRLVVPVGHTAGITSIDFSPDGKFILTGSKDNTAILWDLNGKEIQSFTGHIQSVNAVAFSPAGSEKFILTSSADKTAKLWSLDGKEIRSFIGHSEQVVAVAFSPTGPGGNSSRGKYILTGSIDNTAKLWEFGGKEVRSFNDNHSKGAIGITSVAFSPADEGKTILVRSSDGVAKLWSINGQEIQIFKTDNVRAVAFSPDGQFVLTGGFDKIAKLWDLSGKELMSFKGHESEITSVAFSPDGKFIITGSRDKTAKLWSLDGKERCSYKGHTDRVTAVVFSPDGKMVLTGSLDKTAKLWNLDGKEVQTFSGHSGRVTSLSISSDNRYILMGSSDKTAKLWDIPGKKIQSFKGHTDQVSDVAIYSDSTIGPQFILTGSKDSTAKLWTASGKELLSFKGHLGSVNSVAFSPDGKFILTGSQDKTAKLWDRSGKAFLECRGHTGEITSVDFSSDNRVGGDYILTGSRDKTAKLWDITGTEMKTFVGHSDVVTSVTFWSDTTEKYILTGSRDSTAKLWGIAGNEIRRFKGNESRVTAIAISPPGGDNFFVTGCFDGIVELWDITGKKRQTCWGHSRIVNAVAFLSSSGGSFIFSGSEDNTTKVWSTTSGKELATLIAIDSSDWAVTTPAGLFDASPGAMKLMYYTAELEVIDLEQLKERYYEPDLLAKLLGIAGGGLRPVQELNNLALFPSILNADIEDDIMKVQLEERNGGIGKVLLLLNDNIELDTNVNPNFKTEFEIDLKRFAGYFFPDSLNRLSLRAYNREGWLKGPAHFLDYRPADAQDRGMNDLSRPPSRTKISQELDQLHLYAVIVGTSNYRGTQLNLKYPDKDAAAFAEALRLTGTLLFGKNVDIKLLTTNVEPWPRKAEIARALQEVAAQAKPADILLVYLSGHGITYPPASEKGQFYYLTTDILGDKLDDPATLQAQAIGQDTLQEWIRQVKARKRILILDACNSGRVVEAMEPGAKSLNSDQRRALERMKDRSGMFVLAGSAADKASYEASRYGHGLLTYSLINNMPVVAAANKHFIEVDKLFSNVREEVPRLARGIGKVQDPELIGAEGYAIGLINDSTRIAIPEEKPVFVKTVFMNSQKNKDVLYLSAAVNDYLDQRACEYNPNIAYWAVDKFAGDHYYIGGQYQQNGKAVNGKATLYRVEKELATFSFSGDENALGRMVEDIVVEVFEYLNKH